MARLLRAERGVRTADATFADDVRAAEATAMSCHKDQPGAAHPMRLCAGWLAVAGPHHVPTRMSLVAGTLPAEAVYPDTRGWPPLHASLLVRTQGDAAGRRERIALGPPVMPWCWTLGSEAWPDTSIFIRTIPSLA